MSVFQVEIFGSKSFISLLFLPPELHVAYKVKLSRYTPWRCLGGEEAWLLLILDLGIRWG
jgi:hypothetical protein